MCRAFRPFRRQPSLSHSPVVASSRYLSSTGSHVYPPGRPVQVKGSPWRGLGFAICWQAPRSASPNRVRYVMDGLVVDLLFLSTLRCGNAVTVGFTSVTLALRGLVPLGPDTLPNAPASFFPVLEASCKQQLARRHAVGVNDTWVCTVRKQQLNNLVIWHMTP